MIKVGASRNLQPGEHFWQAKGLFKGVNQLCLFPITQGLEFDAQAFFSSSLAFFSRSCSSCNCRTGRRSETWTVGFGGYCASKTALNMLTVKLARELDRASIKVNLVDPGLTSTGMTGNGPGHSPEDGARPAVALATTHAYGPRAGFYACAPSGELVQKSW